MIYKVIVSLLLLFIIGCGTPTSLEIRQREISIAPIIFSDSIKGDDNPITNPFAIQYPFTDTIRAYKIVEHDTVTSIMYIPGENIFKYKFKTDTIKLRFTDTTTVTKIEKVQEKWYIYIIYILSGVSVGFIIALFTKRT